MVRFAAQTVPTDTGRALGHLGGGPGAEGTDRQHPGSWLRARGGMLLASRRLQPCIFILPKALLPFLYSLPSRTQHAHHLFLLLHLLLTSLDPRRPRKEATGGNPQQASTAKSRLPLLQFLPPPPPCSSSTHHHPPPTTQQQQHTSQPASPDPKPTPHLLAPDWQLQVSAGSYRFRLRDLPRPPFRSSNASRTPAPSTSPSPSRPLPPRWYGSTHACRVGFAGVRFPPFLTQRKAQTDAQPQGACCLPRVPAGHPRVLLIGPPYSTWWYCGCPSTKRHQLPTIITAT